MSSHRGIAFLAFWESDLRTLDPKYGNIRQSYGINKFNIFTELCLALKWRLEGRLRLWCETGDVSSLTILPIEDSGVAGQAVLDRSAISIMKPEEVVTALTSQTTTVPAFQRIRA